MVGGVAGKMNYVNKIFKFQRFYSKNRPFLNLSDNQLKLVEEFNEKIQEGKIQFEWTPCLCGGTNFDLVAGIDSYGMLQNSVLCHKCGLIFLNPRMTVEGYRNFYTSDFYRLCYEGENYVEFGKKKYNLKTGYHIFDEINKVKPINAEISILEFGAGGGWNLLPFIDKGAKCTGIDYSCELVKLGKQHGINMIYGGIESVKSKYDIIILNHILEHIINPIEFLKLITAHLYDDGIVYIAVPNIELFTMEQIVLPHIWYFTPVTFTYYCESAGLKNIKLGPAEQIHLFGIFRKSVNAGVKSCIPQDNYIHLLRIIQKSKAKIYCKEILKLLRLYPIIKKIYDHIA